MDISALLAWTGIALGLLVVFMTARWNYLWQHHHWAADGACGVVVASGLFVLGGAAGNSHTLLVAYFLAAALTAFLAARLRFGRLPEWELRRSTRGAAALSLAGLAGLFVLLQLLPSGFYLEASMLGLLAGALFLACLFAMQTCWACRHYQDARRTPAGWGHDPPTVTLAIPARNETHALSDCLNAALSSNYPRLEILVLDDCSQDKTSQLIKSFAHAGVRFVQGEAPSDGWLGKNNAYAALEKEATGDYILFMGVDTHLEPSAITSLVAYAQSQTLSMVSVLPQARGQYLLPLLMQHLRYVWQIILSPHLKHIPVSSEIWLVKSDSLQLAGGFAAYKQAILPEAALATHFASKKRYRFLLASPDGAITFGKRWSSQFETSTRLWYPLVGKQPLAAIGLSVCLLVFGLGPFVALLAPSVFIQLLAASVCVIYIATYAVILRRLQPKIWWVSMWLLPVVLTQEAALVVISMAKYEFSEVNWKGRNICYPVLYKR